MRSLEVTVPTDARLELRLQRYDQLRARFGLGLVKVARTSERTRLVFEEMPAALDLDAVSTHLVERALGWLTRLERSWGEPLGPGVDVQELGYDRRRRVFSLGPGLFLDSCETSLLQVLAVRFGAPEQECATLDAFEDLAALLASSDSGLWERIDPELSDEERIRKLRHLAQKVAEQGRHGEALEYAHAARRLRPGDLALSVEILGLAIKARTLDGLDEVVAAVEAGADRSASACLLLARYFRLSRDLRRARAFIAACTTLEPEDQAAWGEAIRIFSALGDRSAVLEAMERLAKLGNEGALAELRKHLPPSRWRQIVLGLEGVVTGAVLRWKLESLGQEERLQQLLFLFADNLDQIDVLGEVEAKLVLDAARRERGGIQRLLSALRELAHAGSLPLPFGRMFVAMCLMHGHADEVMTLAGAVPSYVSRADRIDALRTLRRWTDVLVLTEGYAEFAFERLEALVFIAQRQGSGIEPAALRHALESVPGGKADPRLRELLERLMEIAPDEPVTLQLRQLLGAP